MEITLSPELMILLENLVGTFSRVGYQYLFAVIPAVAIFVLYILIMFRPGFRKLETWWQTRKFEDETNFTVLNFGGFIGDGEWHTIEISTFNDVYEIWIDGEKRGSWQDKKPLDQGAFFLQADFWDPDRISEFDDISVCGLSAPFETIIIPEAD